MECNDPAPCTPGKFSASGTNDKGECTACDAELSCERGVQNKCTRVTDLVCKDKPTTTTPTVDGKACSAGTFSSTGKDDATGGCQACESGTSFASSEGSTSCVSCQNCVSTETQCSVTADAKCYSKCATRVEYSVLGATGDTSEASTYGPCKRCSKCMVEDATGTTVEDASLVNKQCGVAQDTTCNKVSKIKVVVTMAGVTVATFTEAAKNTYENTFRVKYGLEDREKNLVKLTVEDVAASRRRRALGTVDGVKITTDLTIKHQAAAGAPVGATPEEVAQQMEAKVVKIAQDIDKGMADGSFVEDLKKAAVEAQIEVLASDTVQVAAVTKAVDNIQKAVETKVIVEAPKPTVPVNPGGASNQIKADQTDDTVSEGGAPIGPIVGGILGALAVVAVIVFVYKRKTGQGGDSNANGSRRAAAVIPVVNDAQLEGKYSTAKALATGGGTLFCVALWLRDRRA